MRVLTRWHLSLEAIFIHSLVQFNPAEVTLIRSALYDFIKSFSEGFFFFSPLIKGGITRLILDRLLWRKRLVEGVFSPSGSLVDDGQPVFRIHPRHNSHHARCSHQQLRNHQAPRAAEGDRLSLLLTRMLTKGSFAYRYMCFSLGGVIGHHSQTTPDPMRLCWVCLQFRGR